jgi:amino-acid N-acetyltransferase
MKVRKATLKDVPQIHKLINYFARKDWMLPRSLTYLYENIRDFWVVEDKGKVIACTALHVSWSDLAEIKSLAVLESHKRRGIGRRLVLKCLEEARKLGIKKVFALTYVLDFFKECGFKRYPKSKLPHKIWGDCLNCPKFPDCSEIAVVIEI